MNIVFLDSYTLNPGDLDWAPLQELGQVTFHDRTPPEEVEARSREAEILIVNKVTISEQLVEKLPHLKCICIAATGYNNIDASIIQKQRISVRNVTGYSTPAVAQHVFALLFALTNRVQTYADTVRAGRWSGQADFSYWDHSILELQGKTIGIYGLGRIGQAVARIALAFDMRVISVHKHPGRDFMLGVTFVTPEKLFSQSDILTLHVPLTDETHQLINRESLAQMKESAMLINTSRGGLIHEPDLLSALQSNRIAAAALDVLTQEPPPADHLLFDLPNCLITPHQAWATQESRQRLLLEICENIKAFQRGEERNLVY